MAQSSFVRAALPAWLVACGWALAGAVPPPALAQARFRAARAENFRQQPGPDQRILGSVYQGTELVAGQTKDGWVEVTLEGWIFGRSVGRTTRDGFNLAVTVSGGENLRATPGGRGVGRVANGVLVGGGARGRGGPACRARAVPARQTGVPRLPDSEPTGSLAEDTPVRVLARSGQWVRVATEGWIRESDLKPSSPGVLAGVSGAEIRARPAEFEGKTVQWSVQYVALQTADELRREIPAGQRYMLARGPLPESGFIYIILSPAMMTRIEQLQPLAEVVIIARIKAGRSQYLGNPVVDLVDPGVRRP